MTLICINCGERKKFEKQVFGLEKFSETHYIDSEGDYVDADNYEAYDREVLDEERPTCQVCEAEVQDLNDKEYWKTIWEHTDKKGQWHTSIISKEQRDDSIFESVIAKKV